MPRLILPVFLAALFFLISLLVLGTPILAKENEVINSQNYNNLLPLQQTDPCTTTLFDWTGAGNALGWTINETAGGTVDLSYNNDALELFQTGNGLSGLIARSPSIGHVVQSGDDFVWSSEQINSQVSLYVRLFFSDDTNTYAYDSGTQNAYAPITRTFDLEPYVGLTILYIDVRNTDLQNGDRTVRLFWMAVTNEFGDCTPPDTGELCPLVQNANFSAETGWLLAGGSVITNGILTLPVGGVAAQNLTLQSTTSYSAVISTTQSFSGSASVDVTLGTQSQTVEITGSGRFTTSFTTPSLGGPIAYGLENTGPDTVDLDFTCVLTGPGSSGSQADCIAPINGSFNTAENWTFLRGAQWNSPSEKAFLPFPDVALLVSSSTYSLPTITGTQNLLLAFDARKTNEDETGAIMGRVYAGSSVNWTFETYGTEYTFETSLNTLAGLSDAEIAFVNPGLTGSELISSTSDVVLDNVCVFVANRGPNLPTPTDPDAIPPVDLGFNYTSCDQVDGILAFFGVNIQQYRAEYEAGPSVWDPIGWVPWLVSAFWSILALYLCVFMAAFVTLVDILEYLINNFLNIGNWLVRSWPIFVNFLLSIWRWFLATLPNLLTWLGQAIVLIVTWFLLSGGNLVIFTGFMLTYLIQAALGFLNWLGFDVPDNLIALLLNGLRGIANLFIAAWNLFLAAAELVINGIMNFWVGLWNLVAPFFQAVWGYIAGNSTGVFTNPLLALVLAVFNLVLMVVSWVWANVFLVVSIPINFYYAFDDGIKSEAFAYLMSCAANNFWCQLLAGIQLVNQTSAHTLMYPIVIVGIIIGSIVVFWKELWALFSTPVS